MTPLAKFLTEAGGRGPVVGLLPADRLIDVPPGIRHRRVDGAEATTLGGLYTAFAEAWDFPEYFGRNKSAFDDCMRDLDGADDPDTAPRGFLTHIRNAQRLLTDAEADFDWFAESLPFYRDHYRDHFGQSVSGRAAVFAVVLSAPRRSHEAVRARGRAAGVPVTEID